MAITIGVVTLSRNQGTFVGKTMNSVISQNPETYIVYDCGSKDSSRKVISSFSHKGIRYIFVESDNGPSDGLNKSLKLLDDEIFYYLNADDIVLPGAIDFAKNYFSNNPGCDVLHGSIQLIDASGKVIRTLPSMKYSVRGYLLQYAVVYQQATFIRMKALKNLSFNTSNRISWDGELIVDLALSGATIHSTKKVLGQFRMHDNAISRSPDYRVLLQRQHSIVCERILGRQLYKFEIVLGKCIRTMKGSIRRIFPRIEYLP